MTNPILLRTLPSRSSKNLPKTRPNFRTRAARAILLLGMAFLAACQTPPPPKPVVVEKKPVAPVVVAPDNSAELARQHAAFQDLVGMQDRLYRVAAPLLLNNLNLCQRRAFLLGFTAKNKYSYSGEFVESAQHVLGLGDQLQIMGVMPGSGAAGAGIRNGDKLVAIGDIPLPQGQSAETQARAVLVSLLSEKTSIDLTINRGGQDIALKVPLTHVCAFSMELGNTDSVNALADGHRILLTRGMMRALKSDDELANVIAVEMARNALGHPTKLHTNAALAEDIDNLLRVHPSEDKLVALKAPGEEFDLAADKRGLYMLARANYPIENFGKFWQGLTPQNAQAEAVSYFALHPMTQRRLAAIGRVTSEIKGKQSAHKPIQP